MLPITDISNLIILYFLLLLLLFSDAELDMTSLTIFGSFNYYFFLSSDSDKLSTFQNSHTRGLLCNQIASQ